MMRHDSFQVSKGNVQPIVKGISFKHEKVTVQGSIKVQRIQRLRRSRFFITHSNKRIRFSLRSGQNVQTRHRRDSSRGGNYFLVRRRRRDRFLRRQEAVLFEIFRDSRPKVTLPRRIVKVGFLGGSTAHFGSLDLRALHGTDKLLVALDKAMVIVGTFIRTM